MSEKLTPMLEQFLSVKEKHPDKLLLFRMGDFYETFFDDARTASRVLGITLTTRDRRSDNPIPLAGFPYHALDHYLEKIVRAGLKVIICDQLEDPKLAKGLVKRGITEIITPGAILDGDLIDRVEPNYLVAIFRDDKGVRAGLAALDISTGDFRFTELGADRLRDEIQRLHPAEIVVLTPEEIAEIKEWNLEFTPAISRHETWFFDAAEGAKTLRDHFGTMTLEGFGGEERPLGFAAAGLALCYLNSLKQEELRHIATLRYYALSDYMQIDEVSRRNLELTRSMRQNQRAGSLISVLDRTCTPMGARLLQDHLLHPLMDATAIETRLEAVAELKANTTLTNDLRIILQKIGDLSRIIAKIGALKASPRDVVALGNDLSTAPQIASVLSDLQSPLLHELATGIGDYREIIDLIDRALAENPPVHITEGGILREDYHPELHDLREISRNGKGYIANLEAEERERTGIPSLKINYNKVFGYYIEVSNANLKKAPSSYIRKQTLVNAERFVSPELKEYESKVLGAEERIKSLEYELFCEIRRILFERVEHMQQYVRLLAEIDVLASHAVLAHQSNFCRPTFNSDGLLELHGCRHPVVETLLSGEEFIPNDVLLDSGENRIALITGPNMAGKSTYLRQIGLIVIMAQMGSFVPASYADLPVFDQVFTRVGASDNLAFGQSTFLVEMIETANILHNATPRSLILLDEIGRGTSTFDGLSLAWAIVEHIARQNGSKTFFATHYHELTELENVLDCVKNYNIAVREWNDKMIFVRKIERGGADQSYGVQVARLAGTPASVIRRAKQILQNLEEHELSPQGLTAKLRKQLSGKSPQMDIFEVFIEKEDAREKILDEIRGLDLENLTPMDALRILADLQRRI
jgi:DNA mismatch repair protein MutS